MEGKAGGEAGEMGQHGQVPRSGTLPWEIKLERRLRGCGWPDAWRDTGLREIRCGAKRENGGKQDQVTAGVKGGGSRKLQTLRCRTGLAGSGPLGSGRRTEEVCGADLGSDAEVSRAAAWVEASLGEAGRCGECTRALEQAGETVFREAHLPPKASSHSRGKCPGRRVEKEAWEGWVQEREPPWKELGGPQHPPCPLPLPRCC